LQFAAQIVMYAVFIVLEIIRVKQHCAEVDRVACLPHSLCKLQGKSVPLSHEAELVWNYDKLQVGAL
jgi:hypothetical protein